MAVFPAMCVKGGGCVAFPDVCLTPTPPAPPTPIPYPNLARPADGDGTPDVKIMNSNALRKGDTLSWSDGDAAGTAGGGTVSHTILGSIHVKTGSPKVRAKGREIAHHTILTAHNGNNANAPGGAYVTPSQVKVKVFAPLPGPGRGIELLGQGGLSTSGQATEHDPIIDAAPYLQCSPTLERQIEELKKRNWHFRYTRDKVIPKELGTWCNRTDSEIVVSGDHRQDPAEIVLCLAHEVGHARFTMPSINETLQNVIGEARHFEGRGPRSSVPRPISPPLSYPVFEQRFILWHEGRNEGAAALNELRIRQEMKRNCPQVRMPPISSPWNHRYYQQVLEHLEERSRQDPAHRSFYEDQARLRVAARYQSEPLSTKWAPDYRERWIQRIYANQEIGRRIVELVRNGTIRIP